MKLNSYIRRLGDIITLVHTPRAFFRMAFCLKHKWRHAPCSPIAVCMKCGLPNFRQHELNEYKKMKPLVYLVTRIRDRL